MQHSAHRSLGRSREFAFRSHVVSVPRIRLSAVAQNGAHAEPSQHLQTKPSPAENARTVIKLCQQGTLSTLSDDGTPLGTPVSFSIDAEGRPIVELAPGSIELQNLSRNKKCSLQIQPSQLPARALASVTLVGELNPQQEQPNILDVHKCLYFGGLDQGSAEISGQALQEAQPDALVNQAHDLITAWNDERAEDVYRIVSDHLQIPLTDMAYAELLWIDYLGIYVRVEVEGGSSPSIVRVPFERPVRDDRDARSVLTMAAQVAWERERPYTPQLPAIFTDTAAAANN